MTTAEWLLGEFEKLPDIITSTEIASIYAVDVRTVWKWQRIGKIPRGIQTPGGHLRWHKNDFLEFLRQRSHDRE